MQFCEAYGSDVTTWTGFSLLRDIRELRVTCYVAQLAAEHERYVGKATTATVAAHTLLRTCLTGT